ncbi:MAG TPA: 3-keto-5-aminohexanoate cleavage protein [Acidimicrobiales bacterium]|nr:3-keto-5-aminohexanoate cleavage protein [Acidimicrobiales bacterium]
MKKLIIEVALNEYVTRSEHPGVPRTEEEIAAQAVACAEAGASIVHFHPRTSGGDRMDIDHAEDVEFYLRTMELIAEQSDIVAYPTYAVSDATADASVNAFPHVRALRKADRALETFVYFVGATNLGRWSKERQEWVMDRVTGASHDVSVDFLSWCRQSGLKPQFGVREIGHLRHIETYRQMGLVEAPIVLHLNLSHSEAFGPPTTAEGILSLLRFVPPEWEVEWFAHNYHNSFNADASDEDRHRLFNALAICMDGHVRTGVGDLPAWGAPPLDNVEMVNRFVAIADTVGRGVASPAETRDILGFS